MSIAVIGTVAYDSVKTPKGAHSRILGGSASYAATAASLFNKVHITSIIGNDFDQAHLDFLSSRNICTQGIEKVQGHTFHWSGSYENAMDQAQTLQTDLNVLLDFDPQIPASHQHCEIVYMANIDPDIQAKAIKQFKSPRLILMDTMNFWIENKIDELRNTLKMVDVLIINDQELRLLTGISNIIEALPQALKLGPKRIIVKKGEHGAIMHNGSEFFICPAIPLNNLVDPTGAGDSFAGGICGVLSQHPTLSEDVFKKAIITGTIISSFTCQDFSLNKLKTITATDIRETYNRFKSYFYLPEEL